MPTNTTITDKVRLQLVRELRLTKGMKDDAEKAYEAARAEAFDTMQADGATKWSFPDEGTATIVESGQSVLDEAGLLAELTPEQAAAVTVTRVDNKKLEALVELGQIDADLVASFISEVPRKPYLRFTRR